jgi:hypothetical protein
MREVARIGQKVKEIFIGREGRRKEGTLIEGAVGFRGRNQAYQGDMGRRDALFQTVAGVAVPPADPYTIGKYHDGIRVTGPNIFQLIETVRNIFFSLA